MSDRLLAEVVDQTFTSGDVDMHTYLFIDHHCVSFFFFFFGGGGGGGGGGGSHVKFPPLLDCEICLASKFSQSAVLKRMSCMFVSSIT